ncbi:MAG: hypothetical protein HUK03_09800, partial [Bacteroidaceae bacterium]|nr:hypothetical protein [Bacteroidaceae bacterium]
VYFIDSDDVIEPDLLDTCLRHMGENDLLFFNADTMGDEASPWQTYRMASLFAEGQTMTGAHALEHSMQRYHWRSPVWLLFIRRAFLDEARMTFYPGIIHEDELYTGTLFARCPRCAALHRTLVRHRIRGGSTMGTRFGLRNLTCYAIACRGLMEERHPAATCLATYTINNVLLTAKKMTLADKMRGISILHSTGVLRLARTKILIKFLLSRA